VTRAVAVALAALLVLAGCSAVGGPAERGATPTLTPAPVPDDAADSDAPARPGFIQRPIEPWTVGDAHAATLSGTNYTWVLSRNRTTHRFDFPDSGRETVRVVRVANATTYRVDRRVRVTTVSGPGHWRAATTEYAAGGLVAERRPPTDPVRVRPVERPRNGEGVVDDRAESLVARYLDAGETTVVRFRDDGRRRYLVRGRGAPPSVTTLANDTVSDYRVAAVVRPDGRVVTLQARWLEGSRTVVTVRSEYRAVGNTSVPAPEWFGDAPVQRSVGRSAADSPDDWFVDSDLREAAASRSGRNERSGRATGGWVGWPDWASDD
jgi:hypothetical protein